MTRNGAVLLITSLSACESSLRGVPSAQDYSCGTPTGQDHCYAVGRVGSRPGNRIGAHLTGFQSTITVAGHVLPGDGFLTNEFWLINDNNGGVEGWIEIGYMVSIYTQAQGTYFWAMKDANSAIFSGRQDVGIDGIPEEELSLQTTFAIRQTAEDQFVVSVEGSATHFSKQIQVHLWEGTFGGYAQLGQELSGSKDAVASLALFTDNLVYDNTSRWRFATDGDGPSKDVSKPPYGGWLESPTAENQGGVFVTHCCAP